MLTWAESLREPYWSLIDPLSVCLSVNFAFGTSSAEPLGQIQKMWWTEILWVVGKPNLEIGTIHPWVKEIQVSPSNGWPCCFSWGGNSYYLPTCSYNHSLNIYQACFLLGNVSPVSDVAHGPLVFQSDSWMYKIIADVYKLCWSWFFYIFIFPFYFWISYLQEV